MKSSKVSIKTRSTPASLSFKGQATKHTTVKWSIDLVMIQTLFSITDYLLVFMKKGNLVPRVSLLPTPRKGRRETLGTRLEKRVTASFLFKGLATNTQQLL